MNRTVRALDALAVATLALVIAASLARPLFYWDSWAYHLPFSALLWDIGGAREVFVLSPEMQERYEGFPLAAELVQGALWKLAGSINATVLINSAALAAYVVVAARALRANPAVLTFGALAFPLIALHATCAYIDLFVGVCVALLAIAAVRIEASLRNRERGTLVPWCAAFSVLGALAGNTKITGLVASLAIGAFLAGWLVVTRAGADRRKLAGALLVIAATAGIAAGNALTNLARHGNPLYPFDTAIAGIHFDGPEPEYRNYPAYTAPLGPLARPVNWLLSITDLDWAVRRSAPRYTIDMDAGPRIPESARVRTGGYCGALVVAALAVFAMLVRAVARTRPAMLRERRFLIALFGFVTVVTAFMPQSHELRYSLHWPLLLVSAIAALGTPDAVGVKAAGALAAFCFAACVLSQAMLGYTLRAWPLSTQADAVALETDEATLAAVRARDAVCLGPDHNPRQMAYSAVFHAGAYHVEQGWSRCIRFPPHRP